MPCRLNEAKPFFWTNDWILLIGHLGTNVSEISIGILTYSFKINDLETVVGEMAPILSRPQCVRTNITPRNSTQTKLEEVLILFCPKPLQWIHMSVMASQIGGLSLACTSVLASERNSQETSGFPRKGTAMRLVYKWHDIMMLSGALYYWRWGVDDYMLSCKNASRRLQVWARGSR